VGRQTGVLFIVISIDYGLDRYRCALFHIILYIATHTPLMSTGLVCLGNILINFVGGHDIAGTVGATGEAIYYFAVEMSRENTHKIVGSTSVLIGLSFADTLIVILVASESSKVSIVTRLHECELACCRE
jgi:hypothetical protein